MKVSKADIIGAATTIFSIRGPKSASIEEVAGKVGMSKRTLYEIFETKEHLVEAVVDGLIEKTEQFSRISSALSPNAISEINHLFDFINKQIVAFTPVFIFELKKYYSYAYEILSSFSEEILRSFIKKNLARGIAEGIYREDIDIVNASSLYYWQLRNAVEDASLQTQESTFRLLLIINNFFIHGILSTKGLNLLMAKPKPEL